MLSWPPQSPWCHFDATSPGKQGKLVLPSMLTATQREDSGVSAFTNRQIKMPASSFGAFLAGHVGKSCSFYIPRRNSSTWSMTAEQGQAMPHIPSG